MLTGLVDGKFDQQETLATNRIGLSAAVDFPSFIMSASPLKELVVINGLLEKVCTTSRYAALIPPPDSPTGIPMVPSVNGHPPAPSCT